MVRRTLSPFLLLALVTAACGDDHVVPTPTAPTSAPVTVVVAPEPVPDPAPAPPRAVQRSVFSMKETAPPAELMQRCRGNGGVYIPAMARDGIVYWRVCSIPGKHTVWPAGSHHAEFVAWTYEPLD